MAIVRNRVRYSEHVHCSSNSADRNDDTPVDVVRQIGEIDGQPEVLEKQPNGSRTKAGASNQVKQRSHTFACMYRVRWSPATNEHDRCTVDSTPSLANRMICGHRVSWGAVSVDGNSDIAYLDNCLCLYSCLGLLRANRIIGSKARQKKHPKLSDARTYGQQAHQRGDSNNELRFRLDFTNTDLRRSEGTVVNGVVVHETNQRGQSQFIIEHVSFSGLVQQRGDSWLFGNRVNSGEFDFD